jgi:predicted lipoprotein with Yx(FWY)xxD motif
VRTRLSLAVALFGVSLAACSSSSGGGGYGSPAITTTVATGRTATVTVAATSLGKTVVAGNGMTIYTYAPDGVDKGKATCTGRCAAVWPAVVLQGTPDAGTTGLKVSLIARDDGSKQLVVNGRPAYAYSGDSKPGDVNGQALGNVWYALGADGARIGA